MNAREVLEGMIRTDRGDMTVHSPAEVQSRLDAYRAENRIEVRNEAADWFASYPLPSDGSDWERGRDAYVAWTVSVLRNPDPQRPDTASEFFQVGHGYTHRHGYDFLCVAVTTHPVTGERVAIGWHSEDGVPIAVGINQWNHEYDGVEPPVAPEADQ